MTPGEGLIELSKNSKKSELTMTINSLNGRKTRLHKKMRALAKKLRGDENMHEDDLTAYQKMNQELKDLKLWEAEMVYTRNML